MNTRTCWAGLVALAGAMAFGCAGPKPILYQNAHYQSVGKRVAERDIEGCRQSADAAGAHRNPSKVARTARNTAAGGAIGGAAGAAGGAVIGHAGRGAGVGAASGAAAALMRSLLFQRPTTSHAHIAYVDRCLQDLGYEPVGWQ
ncbi:MAG: hypothetical protein IH885_00225 [Myxococcales bacterium]|nr:hypothetical protein [Myxococcales bacterium]